MYKTKLQELCQKKSWELPVYTTGKNGPCHMPRFTATVTVKGQVFETPEDFRSVKEAQNTAAQIAFDHFNVPSPATSGSAPPPTQSQTAYSGAPLPVATPVVPSPEMGLLISPLPSLPLSPLPSSLPNPPPGLLQKKNDANTEPANGDVRQKNCADAQTSVVNMVTIDKGYEGLLQKKNDANTKPANGEVLQKNCADAQTSVVNMVAIDKGYEGLLQKKNDANTKPANGEVLQKNCADTQTSVVNMVAIDKGYEGLLQKKNDANTKPANGEVLQKNCADAQTSVVNMVAIDKGYEGLLQKKNDANTKPANGEVLQKNCADTQTSVVNMVAIDKGYEGLLQKKNDANTKPANGEVLQKNCADAQTSVVNMVAIDKGYEGLLQKKNDANTKPANGEVLQKNCADTQTSVVNMVAIDKGYEGLLQKKNDANTKPANGEVLQKNCADAQTSVVNMVAIDKGYEAGLSMYKNQLQQFAQKETLGFPVYTTEAQGPPHDRRFKSKVCVDGKSYETPEYFSTLKEAEQAAAKVACQALSVDVIQEDGVLYKNLLQEFAQKKRLSCPTYDTVGSGMSHRPVFVSSVTIGTDTFRGAEAKTKKQAEMNAAKVAYFDLTKVTNSSMASTITECLVAGNLSENNEPTTTTKNYHDTTTEEHDLHAKRAKASPGNMNVVPPYHLEQPSNEQTLENQPLQKWKTVVFPRELNWPIPENATVMPYNDEKWVAFKVGVDKEATA